jgi:hypothetical protein
MDYKMTPKNTIVTIKIGTVLQGDGGVSTGAMILNLKSSNTDCDTILCYAPESPHDPFVVWTYNHTTGSCVWGEYFNNINDAANRFAERNY